jgi:murein DD-endopeptidase MepM/ murein hydrolase activator NlpD
MTIEDFLKEIGGLEAENIKFRPGAIFTCDFGLTERYKIIRGEMVWGYPGIHRGVDRGRSSIHSDGHLNPIFCPIDAYTSGFKDWQGRIYGTDVYFYHRAGFRIKVSHMYPDKIEILDKLTSGYSIKSGEYVGPIGSYGMSTGDHSHTEIESWGIGGQWLESCDILDQFLRLKYVDADVYITDEQIINLYYSCPMIDVQQGWTIKNIKDDFSNLMISKNITFLNRYKLQMRSKGRITTLYNSHTLFGM